jgi:hypothetical protein
LLEPPVIESIGMIISQPWGRNIAKLDDTILEEE